MNSSGKVVHVALIGKSCSGKTSASHLLAQRLRDHGIRATVVAEGASAAMRNGFDDIPVLVGTQSVRVQAAIGAAMYHAGAAAERLLLAAGGGVAIHDRGVFDAVAYSSTEAMESELQAAGTTLLSVAREFSRVYALEAGEYETDSNPLRYEGEDRAEAAGIAVRKAWEGWCKVVDVAFEETLAQRVRVLFDDVLAVLGVAGA